MSFIYKTVSDSRSRTKSYLVNYCLFFLQPPSDIMNPTSVSQSKLDPVAELLKDLAAGKKVTKEKATAALQHYNKFQRNINEVILYVYFVSFSYSKQSLSQTQTLTDLVKKRLQMIYME